MIGKLFSAKPHRLAAAFALVAMLGSCGVPDSRSGRKTQSKRYTVAPTPDLKQCLAKLNAGLVQYELLPDQHFKGGCTAIGAVKLLDIGVPTSGLGAMTCGLAFNFAAWARYGVQPAARVYLHGEIAKIETFGTYSCRPIAGSDRLSEHGRSNAVDVSAFVLTDGRRISVKNGWNGDRDADQFLKVIRESACKRFRTVLSPDYNAAHHDHLHFDMGGKGTYCR